MIEYEQWAFRHPQAAAELQQVLCSVAGPPTPGSNADGKSEAWSQQQIRLKAAHFGAGAWRNNVGATPAKCPDCGVQRQPIRYGLSNDSPRLNKQIKSSDVILAIPRLITEDMLGSTIAQFGSIEAKRPGWRYTGTPEEVAQAAWLALVVRLGGYATFSTGELNL